MIETNLMNSLKSIVPLDVDVREYYNYFRYGMVDGQAKDLVTFKEEDKKIWGRGRYYMQEIAPNVYKDFVETNYQIFTMIESYGENAEYHIQRIMEVLNNSTDEFFNNGLGVLSYGEVRNLTELENAKYKKRYGVEVVFNFVYTYEKEDNNNIDSVEFDLIDVEKE